MSMRNPVEGRQVAVSSFDQPGGILSLLQCGPNSTQCIGVPDECDFDLNPTDLYVAIHTKQWMLAVERVKMYPMEASTWVLRKGESCPKNSPRIISSSAPSRNANTDKIVRWRMLPIHAAVIFNAPENVVKALLSAYPGGCRCKDDQGMLPLHLAFRSGSTEEIVLLLLESYPEAIEQLDYKGRLPSVLAHKSALSYGDSIAEAYVRGPSYYYYAARVAAADRIQHENILNNQLKQVEDKHRAEIDNMKRLHEHTQIEMKEKISLLIIESTELKEKLTWYQTKYDGAEEKEKVLVDHTNSLAERLRLTSLSEEHLATKLAKLEAKLKAKESEAESCTSQYEKKKDTLEEHNKELSAALETSQHRLESLTEKLHKKIMETNELKIRFEKERKVFEKQIEASKECLMELIASSKEDKRMFDEDSRELRRQMQVIQSELEKSTIVPKALEDRLDLLQREVVKTRSYAAPMNPKSLEYIVNSVKSIENAVSSHQQVREKTENHCEVYVSTTSRKRDDVVNHEDLDNAPSDGRDDGETEFFEHFCDLSDVDTAIALGDLTNEQRKALETLDLSGGEEEIAATLNKVPGLTKNQIELLVDVASSITG